MTTKHTPGPTPDQIVRALLIVRDDYLEENDGPLRESGLSVTPAQAVTQFLHAPDVHKRLAAAIKRVTEG
jgi:hypothetical protein